MAASERVKVALRAAIIAASACASIPTSALGLGDIEMQSFLNEPLRAEVLLLDTRQLTVDDIRVRLAQNDDFDRLGVERSYFLTSINFDIEVDEGSGIGRVLLSTDAAVLEPYLDLIIEIRWPTGRLLREYTILVDPPAFTAQTISISARDLVAADEGTATNSDNDGSAAQDSTDLDMPSRLSSESAETVVQSSSGDQLTLQPSQLSPGEMPRRPFSANTSIEPQPGSRYMVKRDETLWQIALTGKPSGISVQQAMLDIRRLNPEAFIGGNINRIKAGYLIYLPDSGDITSDDLATALAEVDAQNQRFEAQRSATPGVTAAATLRVSAAPSDGALESGSLGTAANAASQGVDQVGREPRDDSGQSSRTGADVATAAAGESGAGIGAELAAQMSAMSLRLDTLEQILSLKDEQIATLEQALRDARNDAARAAETAAQLAAAPASNTTTEQTRVEAMAAAPTTPSGGNDSRSEDSSGWMGFSWYMGGLAALVVVLFGGLMALRRHQTKAAAEADDEQISMFGTDDDVFAGVNLSKDDPLLTDDIAEPLAPPAADGPALVVPSATAISKLDAAKPERAMPVSPRAGSIESGANVIDAGGSRGYGERKHDDYIDDSASGDALAEADIYIAYGRYLQAIELLETSIRNDPGNAAYRLKLLELYVDMGEDASGQEQLDLLRVAGDAEVVAHAERLLGLSAGSSIAQAKESSSKAAPSAVVDVLADDELPLEEPDLDAPDLIEFELVVEEEAPTPAASTTTAAPTTPATPIIPTVSIPLPEVFSSESQNLESRLPSSSDVSTDDPAVFMLDDSDNLVDFAGLEENSDLADALPGGADLDEPLPIEFDELEIAAPGDDEPDALGEDDVDLDLDLSEALLGPALESSEYADTAEPLLIPEDADQVATKLDLARAYIDMGDSAGARSILDEVLAGDAGDHQQEARDLLSRIG